MAAGQLEEWSSISGKGKTVGGAGIWARRVKAGEEESGFGRAQFEMAVTGQVGMTVAGCVSAAFREGTELEKPVRDSAAHRWD